jgi:enoyl-CoA hydratase/carnithine racemase
MTQSRYMSLVEAVINVVVGYAVAVGMQIAVFPVFDIHVALRDQLSIGFAFTGISLVRGYILRRLFERFR